MPYKTETEEIGAVRIVDGLKFTLTKRNVNFGPPVEWVPEFPISYKVSRAQSYSVSEWEGFNGNNHVGCETFERAARLGIKAKREEFAKAQRVVTEFEDAYNRWRASRA